MVTDISNKSGSGGIEKIERHIDGHVAGGRRRSFGRRDAQRGQRSDAQNVEVTIADAIHDTSLFPIRAWSCCDHCE